MTITRKNPILIYLSIAVVSLLLYMNELPIMVFFQLLRLILLGLRPLELVHYKVTFVNVGSLLDLLGVVGSIGGEISQYNEVMPLGIGRELEVGPEILRMDQQNPAQSANPPDLELRLGPPGMEVENYHPSSRNSEPQAGPFPTKEEIERELSPSLSLLDNQTFLKLLALRGQEEGVSKSC